MAAAADIVVSNIRYAEMQKMISVAARTRNAIHPESTHELMCGRTQISKPRHVPTPNQPSDQVSAHH